MKTGVRKVTDFLRDLGYDVVVVASGGEGRTHLFSRVPDPDVRARAKALVKATSKHDRSHDVRSAIRPPGTPHRTGVPVFLVDPTDAHQALRALQTPELNPVMKPWVRTALLTAVPHPNRSETDPGRGQQPARLRVRHRLHLAPAERPRPRRSHPHPGQGSRSGGRRCAEVVRPLHVEEGRTATPDPRRCPRGHRNLEGAGGRRTVEGRSGRRTSASASRSANWPPGSVRSPWRSASGLWPRPLVWARTPSPGPCAAWRQWGGSVAWRLRAGRSPQATR